MIWKLTRWFFPYWYKYLFKPIHVYCCDPWWWRIKVIWCRAKGHPKGVVYFNPGGWEPDMRCKECGDDLG